MKNITILLIAITLFILPVSAAELFIGEYGLGFVRTREVDPYFSQNVFQITSYPYLKTAQAPSKTPYFYTQFGWLPDYTYSVKIDFRTSQPQYFTTGTFDFYTASGYITNSIHDGYNNIKWTITNSYLLDQEEVPFTVTSTSEPWTNPDDLSTEYTHITYNIVFSNAVIGLQDLEYLLARFPINLPNGAINIYQPNMEVSAFYDPGGEIYEEVIVDLLNQIINAGSDHSSSIPSNSLELESTVGNLNRAEQDLYDRSEELLSSVQPQLDNYITQASSSAESFLPVAGFLTTVFTKTKEVLPPYVVILFTVIPLLLFVGWLIGRFK